MQVLRTQGMPLPNLERISTKMCERSFVCSTHTCIVRARKNQVTHATPRDYFDTFWSKSVRSCTNMRVCACTRTCIACIRTCIRKNEVCHASLCDPRHSFPNLERIRPQMCKRAFACNTRTRIMGARKRACNNEVAHVTPGDYLHQFGGESAQ
jgi:hypothetical protein